MKRTCRILLLFSPLIFLCGRSSAQEATLISPDKKLVIRISMKDSISYTLHFKNDLIIRNSAPALQLSDRTLGEKPVPEKSMRKQQRATIRPFYGKAATVKEEYNELWLDFRGAYSLVFRAYNEGIAYRFETRFPDSLTIRNEKAPFRMAGDPSAVFPETDTYTSWEVPYKNYPALSAIAEGRRAVSPAMFSTANPGRRIVLAEADLRDYPGMYLQKKDGEIGGEWAAYPARTEPGSWGNFVSVVKERQPYIARTAGTRSFPWRVIMVTDDDRTLLNNQLIWKLAESSRISDPAWIKPGKAAWEWWHDAMLPGSGIPSGMENRNTKLYTYYADFAARNRLEYLMIDAGWSNVYDLKKPNPKVDVAEVIRHARRNNVRVLLWCVATTLMKDLDGNLDYLKSLGAAGIKVDFFDRDDQEAIRMYEAIAAAAARRQLVVDFHGCSKPTGLQRTYPNILNYEAVRGAECSKWDTTANPGHHLLIPFVRMLAGPLDYTPGSMRNATRAAFRPVDPGLPSTQGTRCHELAMFVVFDQYLGVLCDSPTEYERNPDALAFLREVPARFDETRVLAAKAGEYALVAKRRGDEWFIGAMGNWQKHILPVDLSFLDPGKAYRADWLADSADDLQPAAFEKKHIRVTQKTRLQMSLGPGGGAVMHIHK
ncbi:MAG: glycoside hydrolase family 97 protein [Mucilaginibacter polytrichastri]|nr:glycoside hydrolase family 97 protein [Mucilaginibacter polytrichastri]